MKILVIAAHPDDEVIGCGGTIAKHVAAGDTVSLLVLTQIYAPEWDIDELNQRKIEVQAAAKVLGIKQVFFGGFPTVKLNTVSTITLTSKIAAVFKKVDPEIVYLPPRGDINDDHDIVHRAALVSCRPLLESRVKKVLSYEISPTTRFNFAKESFFCPNYYVDISRSLKKKLSAMKEYHLELRSFPHPRSMRGLELFAAERGLSVGYKYAECFSLVYAKE